MKDLKTLLKKRSVSSLELVELLNALRDESEPRLRHDHFVRKMGQVLGDQKVEELTVKQAANLGRARKAYEFPKREACLMVMSYGCKLQAMMLDLILPGSKRN